MESKWNNNINALTLCAKIQPLTLYAKIQHKIKALTLCKKNKNKILLETLSPWKCLLAEKISSLFLKNG